MLWMNKHGITVFLNTSIGYLFQRLVADRSLRPRLANLTDVELMEQIVEDLALRNNYYRKALIIIEQPDLNADAILKMIKKKYPLG
jgi:shikimate kinase